MILKLPPQITTRSGGWSCDEPRNNFLTTFTKVEQNVVISWIPGIIKIAAGAEANRRSGLHPGAGTMPPVQLENM